MNSKEFDGLWERVKLLGRNEQWRLRDMLDALLVPGGPSLTDDEIDQQLVREGVLDQVPPPITDFTPYQNRQLIEVQGKPVSETIIEERR